MLHLRIKEVHPHISHIFAIYSFVCLLACSALALQSVKSDSPKYSDKELDDLMAKVYQKSELDLENLRDYVFNETEVMESTLSQGLTQFLDRPPVPFRHEYAWAVRDGYFVRSPVLINGKKVSADEQKAYEEKWIKAQQKAEKWKNSLYYFVDSMLDWFVTPADEVAKGKFYSVFTAKPTIYQYAGEQLFEGRKVAVVKYAADYPKKKVDYSSLSPTLQVQETDTELVTLFLSPEEHQLVGMTVHRKFEQRAVVVNSTLDTDVSMAMDKSADHIWLPKRFSYRSDYKWASKDHNETMSASYVKEFHSYSKSNAKAKFWFEENK
jgi:hypothetical protein